MSLPSSFTRLAHGAHAGAHRGLSVLFSTQSSGDKVLTIDGETTFETVKAAPKSVVYFTAKWCGPCKKVAPLYEELSEAHGKDIKFAKLDIDAQDEIAANSGINVVPTFQFFESGKLVNEVTKLRETHAVLAHGFVSPCCPVTLLQITGADMFALKDAVEKAKRT